jgi:hypothetical protein
LGVSGSSAILETRESEMPPRVSALHPSLLQDRLERCREQRVSIARVSCSLTVGILVHELKTWTTPQANWLGCQPLAIS